MLEIIIIVAIVGILIVLGLRLPDVLRESRGLPSKQSKRPVSWLDEEKPVDPLGLAARTDLEVPAHEAAPSLDMADALYRQQNLDKAERMYLMLARQDPRNPKLYNRLGVIFLEQRNYSDARDAFKAALEIDDSRASRHYNYAMALYHLGNYREAQDAMIQALKRDPKSTNYQAFAEQIRKARS